MFSGHTTCSGGARKDSTRTLVQKLVDFLNFFKGKRDIFGLRTLSSMFFIFAVIKKHSVEGFLLPLFIFISASTCTHSFIRFILVLHKTKGAFLLRESALSLFHGKCDGYLTIQIVGIP